MSSKMLNSVDYEVNMPPDDSISAMEFCPAPGNLLCAASWDKSVRVWNVRMDGIATPKISCNAKNPVLDVSWSHDSSKIYFTSGSEVHQWDLLSNKNIQVGVHDAGVRSCHWIKAPNYSCLMTASWDKTVKFWDTRSSKPMLKVDLPDRCYAADVLYPMAAFACANNKIMTYSLDQKYSKTVASKLTQQMRCISLFKSSGVPAGFVVGGIDGRAAVHYFNGYKDTFVFKSHRTVCSAGYINIYAVNDVKHHPVHNTLVTAGSDGKYVFWDTHVRDGLFMSNPKNQPITKCCFNADGQIFAYALGYDWAQGHEHYDPKKKPQIFLHPCFEEMRPKNK